MPFSPNSSPEKNLGMEEGNFKCALFNFPNGNKTLLYLMVKKPLEEKLQKKMEYAPPLVKKWGEGVFIKGKWPKYPKKWKHVIGSPPRVWGFGSNNFPIKFWVKKKMVFFRSSFGVGGISPYKAFHFRKKN